MQKNSLRPALSEKIWRAAVKLHRNKAKSPQSSRRLVLRGRLMGGGPQDSRGRAKGALKRRGKMRGAAKAVFISDAGDRLFGGQRIFHHTARGLQAAIQIVAATDLSWREKMSCR